MNGTLHPVVDMARDLAGFLSQAGLDTAAVAARVGRVAHDPGVPLPIDIVPSLAAVQAAQLSRYPDSGLPFALSLTLAPAQRPRLADLEAAFGDPVRIRTDRGFLPTYAFYLAPQAGRCSIAIFAVLDGTPADGGDSPVTILNFRRDLTGAGP